MGPFPNLVHWASVARGTTIIAEYTDGDAELAAAAFSCLQRVPPLHSRFTRTTKRHTFDCLMEDSFRYSAIVDEALGKVEAFKFLERVRIKFKKRLEVMGLSPDGEALEAYAFQEEFLPVFRLLVEPLLGAQPIRKEWILEHKSLRVQHQHIGEADDREGDDPMIIDGCPDNRDTETPEDIPCKTRCRAFTCFRDSRFNEQRKNVSAQTLSHGELTYTDDGKVPDEGHRLEIWTESGTIEPSGLPVKDSGPVSSQHRLLWRSFKIVILLLLICVVALSVWLGVCKGLKCIY